MFGWIKRLGLKKPDIHRSMGAAYAVGSPANKEAHHRANQVASDRVALMQNPEALRVQRIATLKYQIFTAKRQKKKHSHLAAELARLEQADRSPTHMIQEPGR